MITFIALVVILLGSFVFLPQVSEAVGVTVGDPTGVGQVLRFLLNVRYKLIALAHFNKPQFTGRVDQIFVHPLKSGGYISVKEWPVDHQGFKYDRQFMAAYWDDKIKAFQAYTLRNAPRLALVKLTYLEDQHCFKFTYPILNSEEFESFTLPCEVSDEYIKTHSDGITESTTNLWGVQFESISIGKALPQSFRDSMNFNRPNTTLLYTPSGKRCLTGSPPELPQLRKTNFQDYYPLMIMSQDEIDEVNARMKAKGSNRHVTASNFRPNIVVKGLGKSIDDMFKFRIRDPMTNSTHYWKTAQKCPRCSIPNVDMNTGTFDKTNTVSKTLGEYRKIDAGDTKAHFLGLYCVHIGEDYIVKVGDYLDVMEEKVIPYMGLH